MVASLLKGYNPNLSPLFQQPTFSPPLSQQFTIPPQPTLQIENKLGRRLLQDNLAVRFRPIPATAAQGWCSLGGGVWASQAPGGWRHVQQG